MSFVKPSLSHRRSSSSSPTVARIRKTSGSTPKSSPLNSSSQSIPQSSLRSGSSDLALHAFFSNNQTPISVPRRRSHRNEENSDAPRKRRKRNPEAAHEITRETPILRQPSSSGTDFTKSCASSASSSTSGGDNGEPEVDIMEEISMQYNTVSAAEKEEVHAAIDALVEDEELTQNQGDAAKEIFDNTFDQRQLYDDWLVPDPNNVHADEDEGVGTEEDEEDKKTKSSSPKLASKIIPVEKMKEVLLYLRDGVAKFSLRWREARDKKADPTIHHRTHRSPTYRSLLLHRDSNHCIITHIRDSLIAAHILPFTIASLARTHRFWSFMRLMLGPAISDKLFLRYGSKPTSKRLGNTGINSAENGWILRSNIDEAFGRMECYLEPVADEPNKYVFNWLEEPDDLPNFSKTHTNESKRRKPLETGEVIDLTPAESTLSQKSSSPNTYAAPQAPSRTLITIQAAIHKLAHKFRGQADVFDSYEDSDGSEAASSIEDSDGEHQDTQEDPALPLDVASPSLLSNDKVCEWLRSVSPASPEAEIVGVKRKRSDFEEDEETLVAEDTSQSRPTTSHESHRPLKRTKTTHASSAPQPPQTARKPTNPKPKTRKVKVAAATAINEAGLLSPGMTNKSETSPEERIKTRRYITRECTRALTYEPTTPKATPTPAPATIPTPSSAIPPRKRGYATAMEEPATKARAHGGAAGSRKRKRLS